MEIPSKYNAKYVETKWYNYWLKQNYFSSKPDERTPYTIVIPPPNVTGVLHMGHMLNNTIQDVLIRRARLLGKNACWVPGTDHASIATEAKVVAKLKAEGIDKNAISREAFLEHAWEWTHKYGGVILEQLKKLGCSCDWERTKFTMDKDLSQSVIKVFVNLYNQGLIYRGYRMVNWDPVAKTTLSDEEVNYEERNGNLYYIKYPLKNSEEALIIATTRPETIFGDTAICVNPNDERFKHVIGQHAIVPICNREIPIIADEYVDMTFGTGCLKVTPAHDENDNALGNTHQLEVIDIFNDDASLNHFGLHYEGKDRFEVRKAIVKELNTLGQLYKTEPYTNKVGTSERTKAVIEPRLSYQWFLKMKDLAKPALKAVLKSEEVKLYPKKFKNTYRHWLEHIRDWNISRQLYWGHQIPAFYYGDGKDDFVVAESKVEAIKILHSKYKFDLNGFQQAFERGNITEEQFETAKANAWLGFIKKEQLQQDNDVLDTWFSSWLWPISVFNGILEPDNEEINYYYPTNDLVTGPDILFFWVARMIIAGYHFKQEKPFKNVYFTGLVRDKQRRKMSKQLDNSPDALKLIDAYGADGVRVGLLLSAAAGNDLLFDESLCQQGKQFANKIWNAFRLIKSWQVDATATQPYANEIALNWYASKFQIALVNIEDHFSKYRISDALMVIYKLIWDDFASWLLEIIKPDFQQPIDAHTHSRIVVLLEDTLRILHPFMPFITEEIWHFIADRNKNEALIINAWPTKKDCDETLISSFEFAAEVVSGIRHIRKQKEIAFKEIVQLYCINNELVPETFNAVILKLGNLSGIEQVDAPVENAVSFRVKSNEYFIPLEGHIDQAAEIEKLTEELRYMQGFLKSVQKKLSNQQFIENAPEQVVKQERKKEADALAKIETLKGSLNNLN